MTDLGTAAKLRAAFELSPTILSVSDLETGRLLEVNEAFLRITGWTREEIIGRPIPELDLETLRAGGTVRDMEARFRTKRGDEVVAIANADLVVVDGRTCVITALVDITARKHLEEQQRARRDEAETLARAKDEFLAMLGHELRDPLGTITNALAVLNRRVGDHELRRMTALIGRQIAQLTRLVDDLLDVARLTSGKIELHRELVDLRDLARRCVETLAEAGRTGAHRVRVEGEAVHALGDPARLRQVVGNLLDNALKYTPPGGEVVVVTAREDGSAVLRVRDTGEGIRADVLARGGLGLGLALVKRLVELHGGSVSAAGAGPGRGSEFTMRLPAVDAPRAIASVAGPAATSGQRRRVLIVEDNADARESLQLLLELAGHEVETAADGASGLRKVSSFRPEVALIDVGLPGIDGYDLVRRLRSMPQTQATRLIALTGYGQAADQRRALEAGFDVHLTKPVDPDRLQRLIAAG